MFSKDFMRYLINYQPDNCETVRKDNAEIREIEFKNKHNGYLAKAYITIK